MKTKIILLLMVLPQLTLHAQKQGQELIDSLLHALPNQKEDTNKIKVLYRLSGNYSTIDIGRGLQYGQQALLLAKKLNWATGLEKSYNSMGLNFWRKGDFVQAVNYFDTVIQLSEQHGDKIMLNKGSLNKGSVYNVQGYYPKALEYYMKCLKVEEQIGDSADKALCLQNIGSVYLKTGNFAKALDYDSSAMALYKQLANSYGMAQALQGLADGYDGQHDHALALRNYQSAFKLYEKINDQHGMAGVLHDMAETYAVLNDFNNSIACFSKAIAMEESMDDEDESAVSYPGLAGAYINAVKYGHFKTLGPDSISAGRTKTLYLKKAGDCLAKALFINKRNGSLDGLQDTYRFMAQLDSIKGDYLGAYEAYKKYSSITDSLFNTTNKQTMQQLEDERQIDLRDKQLQISALTISNQQQQRWLYITGLVFLFIAGAAFYVISRRRRKTNIKLNNLNHRLDEANKIKTRFFAILSHDLRSPVSGLMNYLYLQKEAPDLLAEIPIEARQQKLEDAAQNLLDTMEDLLLWSKQQMESFKPQPTQINIDAMFEDMHRLYPDTNSYQLSFNAEPGLQLSTDENYIKTIMRNLTTNAIRAVSGKHGGLVAWKAWQQQSKLFFSITDNGAGISLSQQQALFNDAVAPGVRGGLGLHLVRDLAKTINCNISVESIPGRGSVFTLCFS